MNREIKFRGKNALSGHWVYGFLTKKKNRKNGEIYFAIAVDDCSLANTIPVHAETVGEFTGLKDVDGVEIYEGDIIQKEEKPKQTYKVEMIDGVWCGVLGYDYQALNWLLLYHSFKVIGNVYDNPELLEVGK